MKHLRWAISGLRYHKSISIAIFCFFTAFLLLVVFLSNLIYLETLGIEQILERWEQVQSSVESVKLQGFDLAISINNLLLSVYSQLRILLFGLFVLASFIFSFFLLRRRKNELFSFFYLGLNSFQVGFQFILEAVFPLLASFFITTLTLFLFQSSYNKLVVETNNLSFTAMQPAQMKISFHPENEQVTSTEITNVFPKEAFFFSKNIQLTNFSYIGKAILIGFSGFSLTFLFCYFVSVMLYSYYFRHDRKKV